MKAGVRRFTLHVPEELYEQTARIARRRGMSVNEVTLAGLQGLAARESQAELMAAYELVGGEAEADVEDFLAAQAEVIGGDE